MNNQSVGIVALTGYSNFGNRLQNFALQETLLALGCQQVDTVFSVPRISDGGSRLQLGVWRLRLRLGRLRAEGTAATATRIRNRFVAASNSSRVSENPLEHLGHGREMLIHRFVEERISQLASDYTELSSLEGLREMYDLFVVGSDQVWNPRSGLRDHLRFADFASPKQRVAYAASVGVSELPSYVRSDYRQGLLGMAHVSVREQRASEIVRGLTGREVPVVLDPTMLLEAEDWNSLAVVPSSLPFGGYVAEFFLGSATDEEMFPVGQYSRRQDLDRVDLKSDTREAFTAMGPLEFIGAIRASRFLVTDSFHAAVFATIFRVPYLLKGRGAMNSRLDSLLQKSGLSMPRWGTVKELEASIDIDWDTVHQNIARERAYSLGYLRSALSLPAGA